LVAQRRIRRTLAGLMDAIQSLAGSRGRKSVIVYTEGFIRSPRMPEYDRVIDLARRSHVVLYAVDPRGLTWGETSPGELDKQSAGTIYLAVSTGGRATVSNDLAEDVRRVGRESSVYYLLGFPPGPGKSGERKLKVRVRRDGLEVRAPDRYLAGDTPAPPKAVSPVVDAVALVQDSNAIDLRVATLFPGTERKGRVLTTLAVELPQPARVGRRIDLLVEARPSGPGLAVRDSAELEIQRSGEGRVVVTRELDLAPGLWQARVVVRDATSGEMGSLLHTFDVPKAEGLRLSSPILSDALESERVPRPRIRVSRSYRPDAALYCLFRVLGARTAPAGRPRVRAGYVITRSGEVIQQALPSRIEPSKDGQVLRLLGFGLAGFTP
jgi:hypothetical protein